MAETQTKKLNLRALKKPESEEKETENPSVETISVPENKEIKVEENASGENDSKKDISNSKSEEGSTKKISLNMLKKDKEDLSGSSSEETNIPETTDTKIKTEKTNIVKISLKSAGTPTETKVEQETSQENGEDNINKTAEVKKDISFNFDSDSSTVGVVEEDKVGGDDNGDNETSMKIEGEDTVGEKNQNEVGEENEKATKDDKNEKKEEVHTIASPEENHDNTAVINAVIGEAEEEEKEGDKDEEEVEEKVEFQNYESSFKQQSTKVIERIRNFRYAPKTRKGLVLSLIVFISCFVSGIMFFIPNHPLNEYKTNLLETHFGITNENKADTLTNTNPFPDIKRDDDLIDEDITGSGNTEDDNLYTDTEDEEDDGDNQEITQVPLTEKEIRINKKKKEVLRSHLLEKYTKK